MMMMVESELEEDEDDFDPGVGDTVGAEVWTKPTVFASMADLVALASTVALAKFDVAPWAVNDAAMALIKVSESATFSTKFDATVAVKLSTNAAATAASRVEVAKTIEKSTTVLSAKSLRRLEAVVASR